MTSAKEIIWAHFGFQRKTETIPVLSALGRSLAKEVSAKENIPGFTRSTMDGFAVRARDTFGASEGLPAYLEIAGEVTMGKRPAGSLGPGQAWRIATGGMLPPEADAVVMFEYTETLEENMIGVVKPVAPGENVLREGEDVAAGVPVLLRGHQIKAPDLGILAAVGITEVEVFCRPKVGVISTGDEVVAPSENPVVGKIRDINSYTIYGGILEAGGEPRLYGIVRDDFQQMQEKLCVALKENDFVLISGGSSVGTRDMTAKVINSMGRPGVLFHGVSMRPGKPVIGAVVEEKPIFGLPGNPASALIVFQLLIAPLLKIKSYFGEEEEFWEFPCRARITRNLRSAVGREDFIRAKIFLQQGDLYAEPILGKSGLISTFVKANGLVRIPAGKEGVEAGEIVEVKLF